MSCQAATPTILIAGAGPTGLALALSLAQNRIPVRIIEKRSEFHSEQRGSGIHPRTLEVFDFLGIIDDVYSKGYPLPPFRQYKLPGGVETLSEFYAIAPAESTPSIPHNNPFVIGQCHTEAILRAHLAKYGVAVEMATELQSLEQYPDYVEATILKHEGDKEVIATASYRWLVGADGGRSVVRKQLGLSFDGQTLPDRMILGEFYLEGLDTEHWHRWNDWSNTSAVTVAIRPTETKGLFWFMITGNVNYEEVLSGYEVLLKVIKESIQRTDLVFGDLVYMTEYRPNVRMVNKFGDGRVFLAGDAAHVHTPQGGQGLNTSVQDAFNLGWKLSLVEKGLASPTLLSTYSEERLPVIKRMIDETMAMYNIVMSGPRDKPRRANEQDAAWRGRQNQLKQLGINYRWSSILVDDIHAVDTEHAKAEPIDAYGALGGDGLHAGDRAPDAPALVDLKAGTGPTTLFRIFRPTHHTVLLFGSDASVAEAVLGDWKTHQARKQIRIVAIHPKDSLATTTIADPATGGADLTLEDSAGHAYSAYGVSDGQSLVVIVRPDGVIGGMVSGAEGVRRYFAKVFSGTCD